MVLETVVGPLVQRWRDQGIGLVTGSTHMAVLAFADDLYLLGRSKAEVERMTPDLVQALEDHGLALQPAKRAWFAMMHDPADE